MAEFSNSIALVIGINEYQHGIPPLDTARNDAQRLATLLAEDHGYDVTLLIDEAASRENIKQLLTQALPEKLGPEDRMLFYFAGHGVALDSDTGPNGYLLPQDARRGEEESYLHMPSLHDALCELQCRHMLVVLDSCFGGAFRWSSTRDVIVAPKVIHRERYERFTTDPAWQVITSASHDQVALDQLSSGSLGIRSETAGGEPHSPFALALFEGLQGAADVIPADNLDGVITATELYLYVEDRLQSEALAQDKHQTPRLWPLKKHDKGEFIFHVPGHELNLPPAPPLNLDNNPYLGLRSYDAEDKPLFFGRSESIAELKQYVSAHPMTVVLGASGTGKSSLVKAGLLPRLDKSWLKLPVFRFGRTPMAALQHVFGDALDIEIDAETSVQDMGTAISTWLDQHSDTVLVLAIDQFEELVTMCADGELRQSIQQMLADLVASHPAQIKLILTLRLDFEPQFDDGPFEQLWQKARFIIPPMTQDELREVIEAPASEMVLYFKPPELVETLINEVIATPGGLPLLSFALSEMYIHYVSRNSDDRAIETFDYDAVGGVIGALRSRADFIYNELEPDSQKSMQQLMLRMVSAESGEDMARRRVLREELDYPSEEENARTADVIKRLSDARLIVEGMEDDGDAYLEPAHDALVRAWDKLIKWVNEVKREPVDDLKFRRTLGRAAVAWEASDSKALAKAEMWSDAARNAQLTALRNQEHDWINRRELAFVKASQNSAKWSRRWKRALVLGIFFLAVYAFFKAGEAEYALGRADEATTEATNQRDRALSAILARRSERSQEDAALLYAVQAYKMSDTPQARSALMSALQNLPGLLTNQDNYGYYNSLIGSVGASIWLDQRKRVAVAVEEDPVLLLAAQSSLNFPQDSAQAQEFVSDEAILETLNRLEQEGNPELESSFSLRLLNMEGIEDPRFSPLELPGHARDLVADTAQRHLLISNYYFTMLVTLEDSSWSSTGLDITDARFAARDTVIVGLDSDKQLVVFDVNSRKRLSLPETPGSVSAATLSPDGNTIVIAGRSSTAAYDNLAGARVQEKTFVGSWELHNQRAISLDWMEESVNSLQYTADGRFVVAGGSKQLRIIPTTENPSAPQYEEVPFIRWWKTNEQFGFNFDQARTVSELKNPVVSPDGNMFAAQFTGPENSEHVPSPLWNLETGEPLVPYPDATDLVRHTVFSPDSRLLVLGLMIANDYRLRFIDTRSGSILNQFDYGGLLESIQFSGDGQRLRASHDDYFDFRLIKREGWSGSTLPSDTVILAAQYSPAADLLATLGGDVLQLWNLTGQRIASTSIPGELDPELEIGISPALSFSPDGKLLAITGEKGVSVFKVLSDSLQLLWDEPGLLGSPSFSDDSKRLFLLTSWQHWDGDGSNLLLRSAINGTALHVTESPEIARSYTGPMQVVPGLSQLAVLDGIEDYGNLWFLDPATFLQDPAPWSQGSAGTAMSHSKAEDGLLAVGKTSGSVRLHRLQDNDESELAIFSYGSVNSVAFKPGSTLLAVAGPDVQLWDVNIEQRIGEYISTSYGYHSATFSRDGHQLATTADGETWLWDMRPQQWIKRACAMVNRNLSKREWDTVMPSIPYQCTCPGLTPHPDFGRNACPNPAQDTTAALP